MTQVRDRVLSNLPTRGYKPTVLSFGLLSHVVISDGILLVAYNIYNTWYRLGQNIKKQYIRRTDKIMNVLARYIITSLNVLLLLLDLLEIIGNDLQKL
jgi:hypothetical protein